MQENDFNFIIDPSAPYFAGHFPDNPIVPGAVILDKVLSKWTLFSHKKVLSIDYCKFTQPLLANVHCFIHFNKLNTSHKYPEKAEFSIISRDNVLICKGRLIYGR